MKPLGRHLMPGESIHALNHSYCMNPATISGCRADREKPALSAFSKFSAFAGGYSYDTAWLPTTCNHRFRKSAPLLSMPLVMIYAHQFRFSGYDFTTLCTIHSCSCVTHSGVLIRVLPSVDSPITVLILYSRGFSPLIWDISSLQLLLA